MLSIYKKELHTFFNSLTGYIILILFQLGIGLFFWVLSPTVFELKVASMDLLFNVAPFVFMFVIPAITMKMLAEEKKSGTLDLLLTKPVSGTGIVLGKFLASWTLVIFALVPSLVFYYSIYELGSPVGNIDTPAVIGSYIGLLFLALVFCAIGLFASSLTENQVIAFVVGLFLCFTGFTVLNYLAEEIQLISFIDFNTRYNSISRGVLDSRDIVYFLGVSWIFVILTSMNLKKTR